MLQKSGNAEYKKVILEVTNLLMKLSKFVDTVVTTCTDHWGLMPKLSLHSDNNKVYPNLVEKFHF